MVKNAILKSKVYSLFQTTRQLTTCWLLMVIYIYIYIYIYIFKKVLENIIFLSVWFTLPFLKVDNNLHKYVED